ANSRTVVEPIHLSTGVRRAMKAKTISSAELKDAMPNSGKRGAIAYFALDLPHKGQASYVHINEIIDNLRRLGWAVDLFAPRPRSPGDRRNVVAKAFEYIGATWRLLRRLGKYDALYVRAHALAWPVSMAAAVRGTVMVQEINGTELDLIVGRPWLRPVRSLLRWLYVSQYRRGDQLFFVAKEVAGAARPASCPESPFVLSHAPQTNLLL